MITLRGYSRMRDNGTNRVIKVTREIDGDFITLAEVKRHMRIDFNDEDTYLKDLIPAARAAIENYTKCSCVPCEVTAVLENYHYGIELPWGPYVDSLVLKDEDGNVIGVSDYKLRGDELFQYNYGVFTASYYAGYDEETMPTDLKMAIIQQATYMYENRGDGKLSDSARALAAPFKRGSWLV